MQKLILFEGRNLEGAGSIGQALFDEVRGIRQARHCTASEALHFVAAKPGGRKLLSAWKAMGTLDDKEAWALKESSIGTGISRDQYE